MDKFVIKTKVDQVVTREIVLDVSAEDEEKAKELAHEFLQTYPEPTYIEEIKRAVTTKSHFWIPRAIEWLKVEKIDKKKH